MKISPIEKRLLHVTAFLFTVFVFTELLNINKIQLSQGIYFIIAIAFLALIIQYYVKVDENNKGANLVICESLIIILLIIMVITPFFIKCSLADDKETAFKNSCKEISYYELNKNFNSYEGQRVIFTGLWEHTDRKTIQN